MGTDSVKTSIFNQGRSLLSVFKLGQYDPFGLIVFSLDLSPTCEWSQMPFCLPLVRVIISDKTNLTD